MPLLKDRITQNKILDFTCFFSLLFIMKVLKKRNVKLSVATGKEYANL
jgi:hypothetical protein